ncbi:MAG: pantoate--beta-alanine ligase [Ignavibacteriales bacterium]|nr:pantoate--beta-alanine ligase [Ignavibacteriales bacterium]
MTKVISNIKQFTKLRKSKSLTDKSIGLVPTMGALHEGHLSIVKRSIKENDITIVTIFVNPTQFNSKEDLLKYPQNLKGDLFKLKKLKVDFILVPAFNEIYPDNYAYVLTENELSKILCGKYRPGHFDGVLTVVMKLLNIVKPTHAYFGEKDYQQLKLIKAMVDTFFIDTKIIAHPIVRNKNGLALSSRNERLSLEQQVLAAELHKTLSSGLSITKIKSTLKQKGFVVEYVEKFDNRILSGVYLNKVRLIDNVKI